MSIYDSTQTNESQRSARIYKDLNLDFQINTATKDIQKITDVESVKRAVRNLVLTNQYNEVADVNSDNLLNVVDIVMLVNLIIS